MKVRAFVVVALLAAVALAPHALADSFIGTWQAVAPEESLQCPGINAHFTVTEAGFGSTIGVAKFTFGFRGRVNPDGSFDTKSPGGTAHIAGKFSGNSVTFQFEDNRCPQPRTVTGQRVG